MALALAALPACGKCRRLVPKEKPPGCVLYRHKEDLPLDAAPFFDLYADGQEPDSFHNLWLGTSCRTALLSSRPRLGIPGTSEHLRATSSSIDTSPLPTSSEKRGATVGGVTLRFIIEGYHHIW